MLMARQNSVMGAIALLGTTCMAGVAHAQDAPTPPPQPSQQAGEDAPVADTAAEPASPNEIIVTARRRAERVQDVAATIEVLGGQELRQAGVTNASQIEFAVPGLQFGNNGFDGALVGLRGVSSQRGFTGDEAAVAVHIDGVFQPQSAQALARLFDTDRVEVLKGPQGTLYGRNANAGVINIITTAPKKDFGGYARLSYGSFNTVRGEGAINLPIAENQALRISVAAAHGKGYIKNILDDRTFGDNKFVAGRVRYRGEFGRATVNAGAQYVRDDSQVDAAFTPARRAAAVRSDGATDFYDTIVNLPTDQRRDDGNFSFEVDFDFGAVGFKSISGASVFKNRLVGDTSLADELIPAGLGRGRQRGHSFSEELTLYARNPTVLDWRAGLYYTYSKVREFRFNDSSTSPSPGANFFDDLALKQTGNAYAAYVDAGWRVTDSVKLTAGVRYNSENKRQAQAETFGLAAPAVTPAPDCATVTPGFFETCFSRDTRKKSWSGITARAGVDWTITRNNLLYANYGRGFRSGAIGGIIGLDNFFDRAFGGTGTLRLQPLDPEKVDAYEVGTKNSFMDGRVIVNAAAFYTIFKDQLFIATDPGTFRTFEGNLGQSKIKGVDLFVAVRPVNRLRLSVNTEFLSAKIDKLAAIVTPDIAVGNRLPRAPKFSSAAAADYALPIGSGELSLRAEYNYKSAHYLNLQNTLRQDGVGLVNLSARYDSQPDTGWYLFGNLRNLTGEKYLVSGGVPTTAGPRFLGQARPGEPFTFEVGAGLRF